MSNQADPSGAALLSFLASNDSQLGALMQSHDWATSPLGHPASWSQSLRTTVGMMLATQAQIVLFWGPDFVALYNDAYRPSIGAKHPLALGRPAVEHWRELWQTLHPLLEGVRDTGRTYSAKDHPFYIERHGYGEQVYFDISYSAVPDDDGSIGGVLCIVSETTERVLAAHRQEVLLQLEDALREVNDADAIERVLIDLMRHEFHLDDVHFIEGESARCIAQQGPDSAHVPTAVMDIPVQHHGQIVGMLAFYHNAPHYWSEGEISLARSVAERAYAAMERARTQERLRASEEHQRQDAERVQLALAAGAIIGTWHWELLTDSFTVDEQFALHFGVDPALGREGLSLEQLMASVHPDDKTGLRNAIAEVIGRGGTYAHQYRVLRADGHYYWIEANGRVEKNAQGVSVSFPGVLLDVDERRRIEQRALASETKFRTLFAEIDEGFCLIEFFDGPHGPLSDYIHTEANPAYASNTGIPNVVGQKVREMVPAEADEWVAIYRNVLITGEPVHFERELEKTGRHLELSAFRVGGVEQRQVAVLFKDITARKRAEQQLQSMNRELAERVQQAVEERESALARMHEMQKLETIGQLTGGVAHDFNNLLTPIVGALDMLSMRVQDNDNLRRLIGAAQQAAERARTLVQRLLAFARRQRLEARAMNVSELVHGMEDLLRRSLGPRIVLHIDNGGALLPAMIDPNQFELAVLNLAVNARDAMPEGGQLTIAVKPMDITHHPKLRDGRYVCVAVTDTGSGMDAATMQRAVEPFFTTKALGQGTGLGLSMVHGLAAQSGGAFALESDPGKGTTAMLYLPASTEPVAARVEAPRDMPSIRRDHGLSVLLVDDEELVRLATAEMLADAGYTVHQASSGHQALALLRSGLDVSVLVTDYAMPGMTGAQLAKETLRLRPQLPTLMITGFAALDDSNVESVPRLSKPFRQMALLEAVEALLPDRNASQTG